jgi:hypothetical protein
MIEIFTKGKQMQHLIIDLDAISRDVITRDADYVTAHGGIMFDSNGRSASVDSR